MASCQLTKKGYERLRLEFNNLSKIERPKTVEAVAHAASLGDRSENAEYIYGKKRLREIDKRLSYLAKLLKDPIIISKNMVSSKSVSFGCKVSVADDLNQQKTWTIVGDGEADYKEGTISLLAPVAMALLNKEVGDMVEVELNHKVVIYTVLAIAVGDIE
jgi:transcription elongation factor GreB